MKYLKYTILIFLMSSSFLANSQVPTNGLVADYPFTGNANDVSGKNHNGTVYGASLTSDRFYNPGKAYFFDGIDDYIEISPGINLDTFSISLWFNTYSSDGGVFVSKHIQSRYTSSYLAYINNNQAVIYFTEPNSKAYSICSTDSINDGLWHHFVGIYDYDSLYLYIDNVLVAHQKQNSAVNQTSLPTYIGTFINKTNTGLTNYFQGNMDDIRIYNRKLDSTEIFNIYNEGNWAYKVHDTTIINYDSIAVYDTLHIVTNDTNFITIHDSIAVYDTNFIIIEDTNHIIVYDSIAVDDTLIIEVDINNIVPPNNKNTFRIYPNPTKDKIYINNGNYNLMSNYTLRIVNTNGQIIFQNLINQQEFEIDISTFGEEGIYFVQIFDPNLKLIEVRKILLE